jgi:hypothetical protein
MHELNCERTTNPFATRWVRPGAIPYQFSDGIEADQLVARLRDQKWRGRIVGPHGSGKSTLLATLIAAIEKRGRKVVRITLHDGQRSLPRSFSDSILQAPHAAVIVIDGYEQFGRFARLRLGRICRRRGSGLVISLHTESAARGIPLLFRTHTAQETVEQLIERFLPSHQGIIEHADISACYEAHAGDVRETFFALYDLFERRRKNPRLASTAEVRL